MSGKEGCRCRSEVVECRPQGSEPLIDCSGLTATLCDCHFKPTHSLYFCSCESLLLLSFLLSLASYRKFILIAEVISDSTML